MRAVWGRNDVRPCCRQMTVICLIISRPCLRPNSRFFIGFIPLAFLLCRLIAQFGFSGAGLGLASFQIVPQRL